MADSHFDQQAAVSQANEDKHTWLQRDRLELYILVNLAHSRKAQKRPIDQEPLLPRFRALKDAIDGGKLSALPGTAGNPNADFMSRVALSDLWNFLSQQAEHEAWNWAGAFCREWAQVRGVVLPDSDLAQQPKPEMPRRVKHRTGEPRANTVATWKKCHDQVEHFRQTLGSTRTVKKAVEIAARDMDLPKSTIERHRRRYLKFKRQNGK